VQSSMHAAGQVAKVGLFQVIHQLGSRWAKREAAQATQVQDDRVAARRSGRPYPSRQDVTNALRDLIRADAKLVRDGIAQPLADFGRSPLETGMRLREMFRDIPKAAQRSAAEERHEVRDVAPTDGLPEYYTQNFHYQTGGYLTSESARLYDLQVETLFSGTAAAMRRQALRPIAEAVADRDQRSMTLIDVACGTGRLLGEIARAFPRMRLEGCDLSQAYVDEARHYLADRRTVMLQQANAEALPFDDASADIVTCCFLFHELPATVRRTVIGEMARVLKPGGTVVFIDSMQHGDAPNFDGMLDAFPDRFHEPYYRQYLEDDLDAAFNDAGLMRAGQWNAFLSKVMVRRRSGESSGE
ncbi:MAG: class I SAM-dependent methyltransferase, partial [Pseudomonadota bacterium]